MQRKSGYPVANSSIKMPDNDPASEALAEEEPMQRRQQLINFGHTKWGFNNWSWAVSKQDLDFVDLVCGKYTVGVVAFVSITVKTLEIHRENIGYATAVASTKGSAINRARKAAVTNALRETLLSFGGAVTSELLEMDTHKIELPASDLLHENHPNVANKPQPPPQPTSEPKNSPHNKNFRKDPDSNGTAVVRAPLIPPTVKNVNNAPPPVAKAHPMPANLPPAANRPQPPAAPRTLQPPATAAPPLPAPPLVAPPHAAHAPPHPRPNSNEARGDSGEARAERKRRQRLAQEEFRLKQLQRRPAPASEENQDPDNISTSVDSLLMAIPTQEINNELMTTDNTDEEPGKRKSPLADGSAAKRRGVVLED